MTSHATINLRRIAEAASIAGFGLVFEMHNPNGPWHVAWTDSMVSMCGDRYVSLTDLGYKGRLWVVRQIQVDEPMCETCATWLAALMLGLPTT